MLIKHLIQDRRGVASLEFTIIAGTLITLLVATFDFAFVATQQIAMQGAVKSAGAYLQYYPADTSGAASKIYNALPPSLQSQLSNPPTASQVSFQCYCGGSSTASTCPTSGGGSCATPWLMKITLNLPASAFWLPLPSSFSIPNQAKYEVRIQ